MPTNSSGGRTGLRRWWIGLLTLVAAGLIPVYAFRSLGAAGNYAVLAPSVIVSGAAGESTDVVPVTSGGGGIVGANSITVNPPAVLNDAGQDPNSAVGAAILAAQAAMSDWTVG